MCFHGQVENNLVDRYMANDNFYKMSQIDGRIKDPEQRIGEDIFASVMSYDHACTSAPC